MIAAYIRVSTDEQAEEGNSLQEQEERLKAYCVAMGWDQPKFYIDDGYSAGNLNRPAMQDLLAEVEKGNIKIVLTTKIDRFSRTLLDLLQSVKFFTEHKCAYVSASEQFDTSTAIGRMTLQILGTFAEFERGRNSERVQENMMSIAANTSRALSRPCFGYNVSEDKKYVINENEAKYVRLMFDLAEDHHGHRMIAKILNEHGSRTKQGKLWDQTNVKRLMANQMLAGRMIYNMRDTTSGKPVLRDRSEWIVKEGNHPAIIDPDRFDKVQSIIKSRSRAHRHADSETYLLTGLINCGYCGRNMKGSTARYNRPNNKSYIYHRYICASYVAGYGCRYHAVHRDPAEETVLKEIERLIAASNRELKIVISKPDAAQELQNLKEQLARQDVRMQRQLEAFEDDLITAEDLKKASERVNEMRTHLRSKIAELESRSATVETVQNKAKRAIDILQGNDRLRAKNELRGLIDRIEVTNGEKMRIFWLA